MGKGIDGLFIVDKPEGITSLDVVREVKRRLHVRKAGHIGTLDPFATGVLPVAMEEGTKLVPFLEEGPKEYEATLKVGEETKTDDSTGEVIAVKPWEGVDRQAIEAAFESFTGRIHQIPPMFSAVKVGGKPLYRLARKGIEVERKEREVDIFALQIEGVDLPQVRFKVSCSKGTYVRTLAKDIGKRIGCGAHLCRLRRTRSGPFRLEKAISWQTLKTISDVGDLQPWLIPLEEALPGLPEVVGDEQLLRKVRLGNEIAVRDLSSRPLLSFEKGQWVKIISPAEGLVAILRSEVKDTEIDGANPERIAFRPIRVFQQKRPLYQEIKV